MRKAGIATFALLLGAATGGAIVYQLSGTGSMTLAEVNSLVSENLTAEELEILATALARHSTAAIVGLEKIQDRCPRSRVELLKLLNRLKTNAPADHR